MVRFLRSAVPTIGNFPEAVKFAQQIAQHVKDTYNVDISVYADSAGNLYWYVDYADYAEYGRVRAQIATDQKYWDIIADSADFLLEGSIEDVVMTKI